MTDENKAAEPEGRKRHAVWDATLEQFVGTGTHPSKAAASKAKSEAGKTARHDGHDLELREV